MKITIILSAILLLGIAATPGVATEDYRGNQDDRSACTPDVFRLCSAHIPDVSNIISCLRSERRNLSAECRGVMDRRNTARKVKG